VLLSLGRPVPVCVKHRPRFGSIEGPAINDDGSKAEMVAVVDGGDPLHSGGNMAVALYCDSGNTFGNVISFAAFNRLPPHLRVMLPCPSSVGDVVSIHGKGRPLGVVRLPLQLHVSKEGIHEHQRFEMDLFVLDIGGAAITDILVDRKTMFGVGPIGTVFQWRASNVRVDTFVPRALVQPKDDVELDVCGWAVDDGDVDEFLLGIHQLGGSEAAPYGFDMVHPDHIEAHVRANLRIGGTAGLRDPVFSQAAPPAADFPSAAAGSDAAHAGAALDPSFSAGSVALPSEAISDSAAAGSLALALASASTGIPPLLRGGEGAASRRSASASRSSEGMIAALMQACTLASTSAASASVPAPSDFAEPDGFYFEPQAMASTAEGGLNFLQPGSTREQAEAFFTAAVEESGSTLPDDIRERLIALLVEHGALFGSLPPDEECQFSVSIEVKEDKPIFRRARWVHARLMDAYARLMDAYRTEIFRMVDAGILEQGPEVSEWAFPVVVVAKRNGGVRICGDFTLLNLLIAKKHYDFPDMQTLLDSTFGFSWFSALDMVAGFHQLLVDPASRRYLCINTPFGIFRFKRLPMGPINGPSDFQVVMDRVLNKFINAGFVSGFFDDILVKSKSWEEHLSHVGDVFAALRAAGFRLNLAKCKFFCREVEYLGQIVDGKTCRISPARVQGLADMGMPTTKTELQKFLGVCNYWSRYVPSMSTIVAPFQDCVALARLPKWTPDHAELFGRIKTAVLEADPLVAPDLRQPFLVRPDASTIAAGGSIMQFRDGRWRPVCYYSHRFNDIQRRWNTTEQECFAIVLAFLRYEPMLRYAPVQVETDHANLTFMSESTNPKVQRWVHLLSRFDVRQVDHIAGPDNVVADTFTRVNPPPVSAYCCNIFEADSSGVPGDELPRITAAEEDRSLQLLRLIAASQMAAGAEELAGGLRGGLLVPTVRRGVSVFLLGGHLWVPKHAVDVKAMLLRQAHDEGMHPGVQRTLARLRAAQVVWTGMDEDVRRYCNSCFACKRAGAPDRRLPHGEMGDLRTDRPMGMLVLDFLGPFSPSVSRAGAREADKVQYLLIVTDRFSRYSLLLPCKAQNAESLWTRFSTTSSTRTASPMRSAPTGAPTSTTSVCPPSSPRRA